MAVLSGKTILAGVMGWPVSHSLSPRVHGFWLEKMAIDGAYLPLAAKPTDFAGCLRALVKLGFAGVNVTLPHKPAALAVSDRLDAAAVRIGAVNTIIVAADGSLEGHNTDGLGFMENLRASGSLPGLDGATVTVLGAGGSARAVLAALLDAGVAELRLANRTAENAQELATAFGDRINVVPWSERAAALAGTALLVNTTNLGMTGQADLGIDLDELPPDALVSDIVYAPLVTDLLRRAGARGNATVDGLGMLLYQARPGFAAWFGREPVVDRALRDFVLA